MIDFLAFYSIFKEHLNIFMYEAVCNYVFVRMCLTIWMPKFLLFELGTIFLLSCIFLLLAHESCFSNLLSLFSVAVGKSSSQIRLWAFKKGMLVHSDSETSVKKHWSSKVHHFLHSSLLVCRVTVFLSLFFIRLWLSHTLYSCWYKLSWEN